MPVITTTEAKPESGQSRIHVRINGLARSVPLDSSAIDAHKSAIASVMGGTPKGLTESGFSREGSPVRFWTAPDPDLDPLNR